jgi:hypothetical protein
MDQDSSPPPPAYSEQEFDQKISLVRDLSTRTRSPPVDEDGWEVYDPTSFENTSSVSAKSASADNSYPPTIPPYDGTGSSSANRSIPFEKQPTTYWRTDKFDPHNLPSTTPLRIEKKSQPIATQYRVSNSSDVCATYGVDVYSRQSVYPPEDPGNFSSSSQAKHFANFGEYQIHASSSRVQSGVYYEQIKTELEDESAAEPQSLAPPSFEEDAPPSSDIDSERIETPMQAPFVTDPRHRVSCPPPDSSAPQLPLSHEPDHSRNSLLDPYYHTAQPISFHRSFPVPQPLPQLPRGARPISSYQPPPVPFMNFNPSIAYGKVTSPVQAKLPAPPQANAQYDPHSFYKWVVIFFGVVEAYHSQVLRCLPNSRHWGPWKEIPYSRECYIPKTRRNLEFTFFISFPNDVWQTDGQFPQQSSQIGALGQPISARFSQVPDNPRQSNIWQSDRPFTTISTYSPANRSSANDSQFPRYSVPPNQNSIYYGNSSVAEQGRYNIR